MVFESLKSQMSQFPVEEMPADMLALGMFVSLQYGVRQFFLLFKVVLTMLQLVHWPFNFVRFGTKAVTNTQQTRDTNPRMLHSRTQIRASMCGAHIHPCMRLYTHATYLYDIS